MPRLLLVDDNPSIHKIAETLLAATPIELVCVDSAAAALDRVEKGEHFDVALLDTAMAGMDGWTLLARLRELPATARMPIAMMAGVLDTVDPERIQNAPIQGFLKKPVELRELGDRVARLMETPVSLPEPPAPPLPAPSSFATMPAVKIEDLPEFRKKADEQAGPPIEPPAEPLPESTDDVLELTEEDLYPEAAAVAAPAEESLDLEELDLESLRNMPALPELAAEPAEEPSAPAGFAPLDADAEPTPQENAFPFEALDATATLDGLPEPAPPSQMESPGEVELPDLGVVPGDLVEVVSLAGLPEIEEAEVPSADLAAEIGGEAGEGAVFTPPLPPLEESLDWSDDSESMLAAVEAPGPLAEAAAVLAPPEEELDLLDVSVPDVSSAVPAETTVEAATVEAAEAGLRALEPAPEVPAPVSTEALVESAILESAATPVEVGGPPADAPVMGLAQKELLEAMMADPAMMDILAKAVVARLGDQALREVAWEVMPELAERLSRTGA